MFIFLEFSPAWDRVMGKPNKQWGGSKCVRGGAGSKRYGVTQKKLKDTPKGRKRGISWFKRPMKGEQGRRGKRAEEDNGCGTHLLRSTVVTLKTTPLSHRIMKSLWEKGQFPMLSPSLPALNKQDR